METDEVIKLVDGVYKNILEKFNPGARQLIAAGKAYLKALHGAAAASRLFNEALAKIAVNAQQGGTTDIGSALMNIVGVYKEIQDQQMNILKAFYVDLLVPLETNLEKDTKVVQFEQKKFLQQHKIRSDSYSKAATTMKKQRKKKSSPQNTDKEIKSIQALEEQKNKLDVFCEQSFRNAMTQERRRYGFVLERQCSLAKHWMAYHTAGKITIETNLDNWIEAASSRENLPPNIDNMFAKKMVEKMRQDEENASISSALRKTRSIDASCLDMRSIGDVGNSMSNTMSMPRAKSEYNLTSSKTNNDHNGGSNWDQRPVARALYAYLSSGENQLSFLEGDRIALVGNRAKGWQFGENLRTQMFGWFPVAYTEMTDQADQQHQHQHHQHRESIYESRPPPHNHNQRMNGHHPGNSSSQHEYTPDSSLESTLIDDHIPSKMTNSYHDEPSPNRMFGDTIMYRHSKQFRRVSGGDPKPGPPPALPAPVPAPVVPVFPSKNNHISQSHSFCSPAGPPMIEKRRSGLTTANFSKAMNNKHPSKSSRDGITNASLHSSNDSGFANEPPPQPEVDYSDEEQSGRIPIRSTRNKRKDYDTTVRSTPGYLTDSNTLQRTKKETKSAVNDIKQSSSYGNLTEDKTNTIFNDSDKSGNNLIKRTKSFWKFGKSDEILEGMSMWKHRDLVQAPETEDSHHHDEDTLKKSDINGFKNEERAQTLQRNMNSNQNGHSNMNGHSNGYHVNKKNVRNSKTERHSQKIKQDDEDDDENIYGMQKSRSASNLVVSSSHSIKHFRQSYVDIDIEDHFENENNRKRTETYVNSQNEKKMEKKRRAEYYDSHENISNLHQISRDDISSAAEDNEGTLRLHDNEFFDDESVQGVAMKTVKRHEILKQYYSSGTDTERNSTSSDAYDCIVVDDHLVRKDRSNRHREQNGTNNKMEFKTFRGNDENHNDPNISTGTLLPRTKLNKTNSGQNNSENTLKSEKRSKQGQEPRDNRENSSRKSMKEKTKQNNSNVKNSSSSADALTNAYGPWCDLWSKETGVVQKL